MRRSQTRRKVLITLLTLTLVALWLAEDKVAGAASENRTTIRQSVVNSLGQDFTSETKKLDPHDRTLGAEGAVACWKTQHRSKVPYEGRTHIRFDLIECDYSNQPAAQASLKHFLVTAHPDSGHSYEWETLYVAGSSVFRLIVGCMISRANFDVVSRDLAAALDSNFGAVSATARCRCGGGCAAVLTRNQK